MKWNILPIILLSRDSIMMTRRFFLHRNGSNNITVTFLIRSTFLCFFVFYYMLTVRLSLSSLCLCIFVWYDSFIHSSFLYFSWFLSYHYVFLSLMLFLYANSWTFLHQSVYLSLIYIAVFSVCTFYLYLSLFSFWWCCHSVSLIWCDSIPSETKFFFQ